MIHGIIKFVNYRIIPKYSDLGRALDKIPEHDCSLGSLGTLEGDKIHSQPVFCNFCSIFKKSFNVASSGAEQPPPKDPRLHHWRTHEEVSVLNVIDVTQNSKATNTILWYPHQCHHKPWPWPGTQTYTPTCLGMCFPNNCWWTTTQNFTTSPCSMRWSRFIS